MKVRRLILTLSSVVLVSATGAPAPRPSIESGRNGSAALQQMAKFGRCVARAKRTAVMNVLSRRPEDPSYHRILRRLSQERSSCVPIGGVMRFNDAAIAGAMAEWVLQHDYPGERLGRALAEHASLSPPAARDEVERVSACVVRAAPVETAAVFATVPDTTEEQVSLRATSDALVSCVPTGSLRISRPTLRSGLALASYRLLVPTPVAGTH